MTEEKQNIIDAGRSAVDKFITEHYDEFVAGYLAVDVKLSRPYECSSEKAFILAISGKCRHIRRRVGATSPYFYVLKDEWKEFYQPKERNEGNGGMD
jgi:hypothetical protein